MGSIENTISEIKTNKYIVFGGCGCLNKKIIHGQVIIPTEASYHYAPASDYIKIKNANIVENFINHENKDKII